MTYTGENEDQMIEWLGDKYVSSIDYADEDGVEVFIEVDSVDGLVTIAPTDVATKDIYGDVRVFTEEEFEARHGDVDKGLLH